MTTEMRLPRYMTSVSLGCLRAAGGGVPLRLPVLGPSATRGPARPPACRVRAPGPAGVASVAPRRPPRGSYARLAGAWTAATFAVWWVPQVARVARAGGWRVSLRQALRSLRLDHSFRTAGIMRGLKRMLMVRKHSYVQKHFDSRMKRRDFSASD